MATPPKINQQITDEQKRQKARFIGMSEKESVPLLVVSTVFPFTLFPNKIEVYVEKVVINYQHFFFSRSVFPIIIKDLISVTADTNILFGAVKFEITFSHHDPDPVEYLWRPDALKVRRYVTGLMTAQKQGIDLTTVSREEIMHELENLGRSTERSRIN